MNFNSWLHYLKDFNKQISTRHINFHSFTHVLMNSPLTKTSALSSWPDTVNALRITNTHEESNLSMKTHDDLEVVNENDEDDFNDLDVINK